MDKNSLTNKEAIDTPKKVRASIAQTLMLIANQGLDSVSNVDKVTAGNNTIYLHMSNGVRVEVALEVKDLLIQCEVKPNE